MANGDKKILENMKRRIVQEMRAKPMEEVTELNLDNCQSTQLYGLTDEFVNLVNLSLIDVGLTSLKGFPTLPNLEKLELSDNRLCGTLNLLTGCKKLSYLNLGGNRFKDLEVLECLKDMPELKHLDLFNCEVTNVDGYRTKVFDLIPSLVYLDGSDKDGKEQDDSEDEGDDDIGANDEEAADEDADVPDPDVPEDEAEDDGDSDDEVQAPEEEEEDQIIYNEKSGLEYEDSDREADDNLRDALDDDFDDMESEDLNDDDSNDEANPAAEEGDRPVKRQKTDNN